MGAYLELGFELGSLDAEQAEQACFEAGALSVTFLSAASDPEHEPVLEPQPGEVRLWRATRVQALFAANADAPALGAYLARQLAVEPTRLAFVPIADRAWEREWLRDFHAMRFGERLWIRPRHESVDQSDAVVVALDPGLAFGTGTHASTALCLEWLDAVAGPGGALASRTVIDYGCGSGVLGIAALKLGARHCHAFDHDPQALLATRENAAANGVSARLTVCERVDELPVCDLLVANILAAVLIEHAERFGALVRRRGLLLLSGILASEQDEVAAGFLKWFDIHPVAPRDGWVALAGMRR